MYVLKLRLTKCLVEIYTLSVVDGKVVQKETGEALLKELIQENEKKEAEK